MPTTRLEPIALRIALLALAILALAATIGIADAFLDWDLLAPPVQKLAGFLVAWLSLMLAFSMTLVALLALKRIADALTRLANHADTHGAAHPENPQ